MSERVCVCGKEISPFARAKECSDEEFFAYDKANWGLQWYGNVGINSERTEGGVEIDAAPGEKQ